MSIFSHIAERRIEEAIRDGVFDDLALSGQPLLREDFSGVPEELRMGYKILKNAGFLPEELQLSKEILSLNHLLHSCKDPTEKASAERKLTLRRLQLDLLMEKNGRSLATREYQGQLESALLKND